MQSAYIYEQIKLGVDANHDPDFQIKIIYMNLEVMF